MLYIRTPLKGNEFKVCDEITDEITAIFFTQQNAIEYINWQNSTIKATIKVILSGKNWTCQVLTGNLSHTPATTITTGEQLVNFCNKYGLKVENKDAIKPELAKKLNY